VRAKLEIKLIDYTDGLEDKLAVGIQYLLSRMGTGRITWKTVSRCKLGTPTDSRKVCYTADDK
jgi:hypothetical protein